MVWTLEDGEEGGKNRRRENGKVVAGTWSVSFVYGLKFKQMDGLNQP